mmetsp:Transcript_7505/g.18397  ORF Transcript_7505/g.18397 Transcript_7505/m.18397 type:complete len:94 (-) Transcript_7505:2181-2462(-)
MNGLGAAFVCHNIALRKACFFYDDNVQNDRDDFQHCTQVIDDLGASNENRIESYPILRMIIERRGNAKKLISFGSLSRLKHCSFLSSLVYILS